MSTPKWHQDPHVAFDTETTGTDPADARIVTAAVVHFTPGQRPRPIRWVIDPQVDIPAEAAAVHGYTNDRLAELITKPGNALRTLNGTTKEIPADVALFEIAGQVATTIGREHGLIVHNAPYDLTLLEHEARRYDVPTLTARPWPLVGVVDPMVIERAFDPYRKVCGKAPGCDFETGHHECGGCRGGKVKCGGCGATNRQLESLCTHYGVRHAGAHDCADDAVATTRLLHKLLGAWPQLATYKLATLHQQQEKWRREQTDSLRAFFDKVGKEHDGMCGSWPLHGACCAAAGVAA